MPEAPDLDFLAAGDVGHDDRKWSRLGLFTEAHGEILPEVDRAEPDARSDDVQLVDEVPGDWAKPRP